MVQYRVFSRGQKDKTRRTKLVDYEGPDEITVNLLEAKHTLWMHEPNHFWEPARKLKVDWNGPLERAIACYLHLNQSPIRDA